MPDENVRPNVDRVSGVPSCTETCPSHDGKRSDVRYISRRCPRCKGSGKRIIRWVDEEIDEYRRAHATHHWDVDECLLCWGAGDEATPMLPLGATARLARRLAEALAPHPKESR